MRGENSTQQCIPQLSVCKIIILADLWIKQKLLPPVVFYSYGTIQSKAVSKGEAGIHNTPASSFSPCLSLVPRLFVRPMPWLEVLGYYIMNGV